MRNQVNVRLSEMQQIRLEVYATSVGLTSPEVARVAIAEYLDDHAPQGQRGSVEMDVYTKQGEWGGYTVRKSETGFVIECQSRVQGQLTNDKYLLPYGKAAGGYDRDADLYAAHNDLNTVGEYLFRMLSDNPRAKILRKGHIVQ